MEWTAREKKLIEWLKGQHLSPSHGLDHLTKVAEYGAQLAGKYGGRQDIVVAAALTHDLARTETDKHGKDSAQRGAELARPVLGKAGYTNDEVVSICRTIAEHDQPELHSVVAESRILKDADFLDGFGARGILRSLMYTGETGEGIEAALARVGEKMRRRVEEMEFVESRRLGWKQYRLAEVFVSELRRSWELSEESYTGEFIVLEGISGSGKDTQAKMLGEYIKTHGKEVMMVNHPTEFAKSLWRQWKSEVDDRQAELFLMLADRVRMVKNEIMPALKQGKTVISSRSQISAQVYQASEWDSSLYRFCFAFEPVADRIIYLEITVEEALRRVDERVRQGSERGRGFFGQGQKEQLARYEKVLQFYPNVVKVDGSGSPEDVHKRILNELHSYVAT